MTNKNGDGSITIKGVMQIDKDIALSGLSNEEILEKQRKKDKRQRLAKDVFHSMRGKLIMSQALFLAMEAMMKRPEVGTGEGELEREPSNGRDMKLLYEELFPLHQQMPMMDMTWDGETRRKKMEEQLTYNDKVLNTYGN